MTHREKPHKPRPDPLVKDPDRWGWLDWSLAIGASGLYVWLVLYCMTIAITGD